jgi:cob(I)alamin adenosyltransferase
MRVYTRTGDKGSTSLASGTRVPKDHPRLETYGSVDELNSHIGLLRTEVPDQKARELLVRIQNRIFTISSRLAIDKPDMALKLPEIKDIDIKELELDMDRMLDLLPPLENFILPGGHPLVAECHIARTVCRRVERLMVRFSEDFEIDINMMIYINRLSDYLFVLARKTSKDMGVGDLLWSPDYERKGY